jgi:hypothetical protein
VLKVCHLTSAHADGDIRIFHKECVGLSKHGFDVHLIVPNSVSRIEKGVHIHSFSSPTTGRLQRMRKTAKQVYKLAIQVDADVYHFHDPELLPYGLKLLKRGKKVIYDAHEDVPRQILGKHWIPSVFRKTISSIYEWYENSIARKLSFVVVSTPTIKKRFIQINPNTEAICNYPILEENTSLPSWKTRENALCYVGGITVIRGITELVESIQFIPNARLNIAGAYSPESLKTDLMQLEGWKKVNDLGYIGREEIVHVLNRSKIGMVTLYPQENYLESLPIKLFEYMLAGLPVVASNFPLWKEIIESCDCGLTVDPKNPHEIAEAVQLILANEHRAEEMGLNGRKAVLSTYNWKVEEDKLVGVYNKLFH